MHEGGITYDEFKMGLSSFGEDMFHAFFYEPLSSFGKKLETISESWITKTAKSHVDTTKNYLTRIGTYAASIGGRWKPEDNDEKEV